jgi:hypothetical protein
MTNSDGPGCHSQDRQGKDSLCHAEETVGITADRGEDQPPDLQLKCEVRSVVWLWDMADDEENHAEDSNILQYLSAPYLQHTLAW